MRWKWLGLAGLVGAAAVGGAVVVSQRRTERTWDEIDGDELRMRLHDRLRSANATSDAATPVDQVEGDQVPGDQAPDATNPRSDDS